MPPPPVPGWQAAISHIVSRSQTSSPMPLRSGAACPRGARVLIGQGRAWRRPGPNPGAPDAASRGGPRSGAGSAPSSGRVRRRCRAMSAPCRSPRRASPCRYKATPHVDCPRRAGSPEQCAPSPAGPERGGGFRRAAGRGGRCAVPPTALAPARSDDGVAPQRRGLPTHRPFRLLLHDPLDLILGPPHDLLRGACREGGPGAESGEAPEPGGGRRAQQRGRVVSPRMCSGPATLCGNGHAVPAPSNPCLRCGGRSSARPRARVLPGGRRCP